MGWVSKCQGRSGAKVFRPKSSKLCEFIPKVHVSHDKARIKVAMICEQPHPNLRPTHLRPSRALLEKESGNKSAFTVRLPIFPQRDVKKDFTTDTFINLTKLLPNEEGAKTNKQGNCLFNFITKFINIYKMFKHNETRGRT